MTNEEKKAVETIKDLKEIKWYEHAFDNGTEILSEEEKQDIDVILNLLEKQDNRIKELEADNYECNNRINDYIETINKIQEEFLKYDWKNSNNEQIYNQLKSLYNEIFKK